MKRKNIATIAKKSTTKKTQEKMEKGKGKKKITYAEVVKGRQINEEIKEQEEALTGIKTEGLKKISWSDEVEEKEVNELRRSKQIQQKRRKTRIGKEMNIPEILQEIFGYIPKKEQIFELRKYRNNKDKNNTHIHNGTRKMEKYPNGMDGRNNENKEKTIEEIRREIQGKPRKEKEKELRKEYPGKGLTWKEKRKRKQPHNGTTKIIVEQKEIIKRGRKRPRNHQKMEPDYRPKIEIFKKIIRKTGLGKDPEELYYAGWNPESMYNFETNKPTVQLRRELERIERMKNMEEITGLRNVEIKEWVTILLKHEEENEVYWISQRNNVWNPDHGLWQSPGGKIEGKEKPEEAAKRELYEETGLNKEVKYLTKMVREYWSSGSEGIRELRIIYIYTATGTPEKYEQQNGTPWQPERKQEILKKELIESLREGLEYEEKGPEKLPKIIHIDGACGVGKTTIIKKMKEEFEKQGIKTEIRDESFILKGRMNEILKGYYQAIQNKTEWADQLQQTEMNYADISIIEEKLKEKAPEKTKIKAYTEQI
ncbi:6594_t:CDS:2 [Diversispora eburnea]|uniref:6594_t:CDS:1 n=1 Tax=Diversispora eburnea TaxID=1213867 RepID=A0A9N9CEW0_9GLOM|nr:6594_t:CDS:2 [Diversispora eburnea]